MRTVLILFTASFLIALVDAQRKSNFTKPVVSLGKRPSPPVWHRPPEERRKLSIFPKNNMKFVVTPKPVVKNGDEAKEGLPTKIPLMRKFVMQDKNEKGTWSFAPREPLMKSKRFTVTLAPPKFNNRKEIDEMKSDESIKVKTVLRNPKLEREPSKVHNVNKGNLIEMIQVKKSEPSTSKSVEKVEQTLVEEKVLHLDRINDTQGFEIIQMNDVTTPQTSDNITEDYAIDERNSNGDDFILNANKSISEVKDEYESIKFSQTLVNASEEEASKDRIESRVVDLNEIKFSVYQNDDNSLIMDKDESNNENTEQVLSFNDLEILLEKIVNNTEDLNNNSALNFNSKASLKASSNETKDTTEDVPQFDITKPNKFYEIISLGDGDDSKNIKKEGFLEGSIQNSQNMANDDTYTMSETNDLNDGKDLTENAVDSLNVGNLEGLINFIEEEADMRTDDFLKDESQTSDKRESSDDYKEEIEIDLVDTYPENSPTLSPTEDVTNRNFMTNPTQSVLQTEYPGENNSDELSTNSNSEETSLNASNKRLSSEEDLMESLVDEDSNEVSNESMSGQYNITEISNEIFLDNSNNLTTEDISNESINDASNNYTEELSNESFVDQSNNLTGEQLSNESSLNMAGEELSNESYVDKSNNLTEETSEFISETSNNFTGEEISNESSSNMAGEELSNESNVDKAYNYTEEITSESGSEISKNFTSEEILNQSLIDITDVEEISKEALINRFKRSNNIIEEENLGTTLSGFKYTGKDFRLNHDLSYKNINA